LIGIGTNGRRIVELLKNRVHTTGAEIGVFEGDTSLRLLKGLPGLTRLFCIDPWEENAEFKASCPRKEGRIYNANWVMVRKLFDLKINSHFAHRILPLRMTSREAAELIRYQKLNFVFIDANHTYEHVAEDISLWSPKVIQGGLISGDDFIDKPNYGVIKAVREAFGDNFKTAGKIWYTTKGVI